MRPIPVDQSPDREAKQDHVDAGRQPQPAHREQRDRDDIDQDPQHPILQITAREQNLRRDAGHRHARVPPGHRRIGHPMHQPSPATGQQGTSRQPGEPRRPIERQHDNLAGIGLRPRPVHPAVKVERNVEELQQHVAVQLRLEEQYAVERDRGDREGVVPDAPPRDQRDIGKQQQRCSDL
ncbi:hypothetical protein DdX_20937 [Ditylenchus destructor]|uniref:Uncharacterized protein n=1 Tax=Ditylenchus destructor TaxID=166010 RepID=A0AAD4MJW6_9BILA|nr:hypothetical protein DdX_20937 [Ditylenchus destructor]